MKHLIMAFIFILITTTSGYSFPDRDFCREYPDTDVCWGWLDDGREHGDQDDPNAPVITPEPEPDEPEPLDNGRG